MDIQQYITKQIPAITETAFNDYFIKPWLMGSTKFEFMHKANSMSEEEYERFGLLYENSHYRFEQDPLHMLWMQKTFWSSGKYCLLYRAQGPDGELKGFDAAEDGIKQNKKKAVKEGLVISANPNAVIKQLTRNYDFKEIYSPNWLHRIVYSGNGCVSDIVNFFPLSESQIGVESGPDLDIYRIYIKIPDIESNKKLLCKAMSFYGYTLALEEDDTCINCPADAPWNILTFERDFQEYITERVLKENNYMFHISPTIYKEKILRQGLCPKSKNDWYNYPPRVYMFLDMRFSAPMGIMSKFDKNFAIRAARLLHSAKTPDKKLYDEYTIYKIDISKLRKDIKLSYDQNYYPLGVFTADNINPKAISVFYEFNVNDDL